MRACRLKIVSTLDFAKELDIARKDLESERRKGGGREQGQAVEAKEPDDEVEFMAGAVIYAGAIAKGVVEVCRHFCNAVGICETEVQMPGTA